MDKGLTVPKWVLIVWLKIPQMPQNLSAQIVWISPKGWDFDEKRASLGVRSRSFFQCYFRPQRVEAQGLKRYFLALFVGSRIFEPDRKCVVEIVDNIMIRFHESHFE